MDKPGYHLTDFFHGLSEKQGDEIIRRGTTRDLKALTVLFHEGDPARQSYLVLKGRLKLGKVHELGKEVLIRYIGPGELAAMITVLEGRDYPVTAETVGETRVVGWDRRTMLQIMAEYPQLSINMIRNSMDRLEDLQSRYLEMHAEQVEQRIARSLLRIMKQSGRRRTGLSSTSRSRREPGRLHRNKSAYRQPHTECMGKERMGKTQKGADYHRGPARPGTFEKA